MKLFNEKIFNPYWVVGFVDGEGCFSVGVYKNQEEIRESERKVL